MEDLSFLDEVGAREEDELRAAREELAGRATLPLQLPALPTPAQRAGGCDRAVRMLHGTTTLAFMFAGGIVVAADSRSTMGSYVASGTVKKIIEINKYLLGTMAGGAADCSFWERELGARVRLFELRNHVSRVSVAAASKMLANTLYYYRGYGLSVGTMISGWDARGPALYYVDSDGQRLRGNLFSVGSGSTYAYGVLDAGWRWDLSEDEACELGRRAIYHATHRDAYTGGVVNVCLITKDGWRKVSADDCFRLHYEAGYRPEGEASLPPEGSSSSLLPK